MFLDFVFLLGALLGLFYWRWHSRQVPAAFARLPKACYPPVVSFHTRRKPE
jgi:hypothetical protein